MQCNEPSSLLRDKCNIIVCAKQYKHRIDLYFQDTDLKYMYLLLALAQHTHTHNVPCVKYWFGRIKGYECEWAAAWVDGSWMHMFIYICTLLLYCFVLYCIPGLMGAECTGSWKSGHLSLTHYSTQTNPHHHYDH